jgi:hypothetical protein
MTAVHKGRAAVITHIIKIFVRVVSEVKSRYVSSKKHFAWYTELRCPKQYEWQSDYLIRYKHFSYFQIG